MIEAYFDGCCEPVNPGGTASYGAVVFKDGERIWDCSEIFFPEKGKEKATSNNVAEYCGFMAILDFLIDHNLHAQKAIIYGDSKLVIEQMNDNWRIKKGHYKPLALQAREMLDKFIVRPNLRWISRRK